jgi:hypothetical protein
MAQQLSDPPRLDPGRLVQAVTGFERRFDAAISAGRRRRTNRRSRFGDHERNLTQSLADTAWSLLRIPTLEMGTAGARHDSLQIVRV